MTEQKVSAQKKKILLKAAKLYALTHQAKQIVEQASALEEELLAYASSTNDFELGQYRAYVKTAPAKLTGLPEKELKKVQELLLLEVPPVYVLHKQALNIGDMFDNVGKDRKLQKCLRKHKLTIVKESNVHLKAIG